MLTSMSADFNIHVINNENEEYHASNYKATYFSSSQNPFSHMEDQENSDYIAKWKRGYTETCINGEWIRNDIIFAMDDEFFDKIDWSTVEQRDIYVYVDEDIVFNTEHIFVCDSDRDIPDSMYYDGKLAIIDDSLIKDVTQVAENREVVETFMRKNIGKKCFFIAH